MARKFDVMPFDSAWKLDDNRDDESILSLSSNADQAYSVTLETDDETSPQTARSTFDPFLWHAFPLGQVGSHQDELQHSVDGFAVSDEMTQVASNVDKSRLPSVITPVTTRRVSLDDESVNPLSQDQACQYQKRKYTEQTNLVKSTKNDSFRAAHSSGFTSNSEHHLASIRHCYYYTGRRQQQRRRSLRTSHDSIGRMISCMKYTEGTRAQILAQLLTFPVDSRIWATTNIENFHNTRESSEQLLACYSELYNHRSDA